MTDQYQMYDKFLQFLIEWEEYKKKIDEIHKQLHYPIAVRVDASRSNVELFTDPI